MEWLYVSRQTLQKWPNRSRRRLGGGKTCVSPRNHALDRVEIGITWQIYVLICVAAVMWAVATIFVATYYHSGRQLLWPKTLLLPTLLSDSQVSIFFVIHGLRLTVSGQVKDHVVLTCINRVSPNHLPVIVDQQQTMNHIVDMCQLTKFEGGLNLLHEADDDAVLQLESTATAAFTKSL